MARGGEWTWRLSMHKYIIKRVLFLIPTILGVILIIYAIMSITPGTPGQAVLGSSASQQDIDAYNEMIGYNKPFLQKYAIYIGNMLKGDFGTSYFTKQSVFDEILPRYMLTIRLALMGVVLATLIGVPIGVYAAVRQYSLWDTIPSVVSFLLAAVPTFVLGTLLLYEFSLKLNILPSYYDVNGGIKSYIMPALAMSIPPAHKIFVLPSQPCWNRSVRITSGLLGPRALRKVRSFGSML